jgi:hypothetical protein
MNYIILLSVNFNKNANMFDYKIVSAVKNLLKQFAYPMA